MKYLKRLIVSFAVSSALCVRAGENIEPARVREIAATLSPSPAGFGQPITNRTAWKKAAASPALRSIIAEAEKMAGEPDPELTDELYLDFSRTGNRDRGQKVMFALSARLATFTLAECLENRGRFLEPLRALMDALCAERSWTYPAHDGSLAVFNGTAMKPDLRATQLAFDLATADYLLGDKLPAATRQSIHDNIRKRVLAPVHATIEGRLKEASWLRISNNWNAVCLAGTVGAALAVEESPEERAWYIAAAEQYILHFLRGFGKDGYCYEGVGYWNYGFGNFVLLTEDIRQATDGRVDLFALPEADMPARFGSRDEILNNIYPTISDVNPGTTPDTQIIRYANERLNLQPKLGLEYNDGVRGLNLAAAVFKIFAVRPWPVAKLAAKMDDSPLRTWFDDGGVLIARPPPGDPDQFAVVLKGGSNGESHNHNDVGSFSVVLGRTMILCDPGGEVYTRRTFSAQRYESGVLNSFGHAVPVVAGQLQAAGASARAVVIETNFSVDEDRLVFDLRSAYPVPDLKKLERTFVYHRGKDASLFVRDEAAFKKPEQFESALITWGDWKIISAGEFEITDGNAAVRIKVDAGGKPFTVRKTLIDEDVHTSRKPWHIGIVLNEPEDEAAVTFLIQPVVTK